MSKVQKFFMMATIVAATVGFAISLIQGNYMVAAWQFIALIWIKNYMTLANAANKYKDMLVELMGTIENAIEKTEQENKTNTQTNKQ